MFVKPAFCFAIGGCLCISLSIRGVILLKNLQAKGIESTGIILSYQSGWEGYKTPIVEFTPTNGELIQDKPYLYSSTDLSKIRSYKNVIGNQISILYDPENPKKFILNEDNGFNYFALTLAILVGLAALIVSICSFLGYIKMKGIF